MVDNTFEGWTIEKVEIRPVYGTFAKKVIRIVLKKAENMACENCKQDYALLVLVNGRHLCVYCAINEIMTIFDLRSVG